MNTNFDSVQAQRGIWLYRLSLNFSPIILGVIAIWALVALTVVWLLWSPIALSVDKTGAPPTEMVVTPGQVIRFGRRICVDRDLTVLIAREFRDGVIYTLPNIQVKLLKGCQKDMAELVVPSRLPPGAYKYQETLYYHSSPLRVLWLEMPEIPFLVVP